MKAKLLALSLSAICFIFIGCKEETGDYKAKRLGLICINGYVFRETSRLFGIGTTTLESLNITCENGKVEVN